MDRRFPYQLRSDSLVLTRSKSATKIIRLAKKWSQSATGSQKPPVYLAENGPSFNIKYFNI